MHDTASAQVQANADLDSSLLRTWCCVFSCGLRRCLWLNVEGAGGCGIAKVVSVDPVLRPDSRSRARAAIDLRLMTVFSHAECYLFVSGICCIHTFIILVTSPRFPMLRFLLGGLVFFSFIYAKRLVFWKFVLTSVLQTRCLRQT